MKISWNWGTKLFVFTVLFMIFIIVFVVLMTQQKIDLVEKDYYPKGQEYQQRIEIIENAKRLNEKVEIENAGDFLMFTFQSEFETKKIEGIIELYRPSDELQDIKMEISIDSLRQHKFPVDDLEKGKYIAKIEYYVEQKGYYQETPVFIRMF